MLCCQVFTQNPKGNWKKAVSVSTPHFTMSQPAKGPKEGNHEERKQHKEELFSSFVAFVFFVVQGFYAFCDNL